MPSLIGTVVRVLASVLLVTANPKVAMAQGATQEALPLLQSRGTDPAAAVDRVPVEVGAFYQLSHAPQGPTGRYATIGHKLLNIEAVTGGVTATAYAALDKMIYAAVSRVQNNVTTTAVRDNPALVLKEIDAALTEANVIYPSWDYVLSLSEGLTPVELDQDGVDLAGKTIENINRRTHVAKRGPGVYYVADCDILSFLYLSVGDVLDLPLRLVERPQYSFGGPSHNYVRWVRPDGTWIDWETMTGDLRGSEASAYVLSDGQFAGYMDAIMGDWWLRAWNVPRAMEAYRAAVNRGYTSAATLNQLAWYLATDSDPTVRAPAEAMKYADMLCAGQPTAGQLDTCAAAAARYGAFDKAVKQQMEAIAKYKGEATKARFRQRLALYRAKRPYTQARRREQRAIEACDDNADWLKTSVGDRCPDPSTRHW